jgi:alpha-tubulin suppressor-like RCC1 family protein
MGTPTLRRALGALLLALCAGCVDVKEIPPRCTDGRSRCVTQVSLGAGFGCATLRDRSVWCWGRNDESQLGYPSTDLCAESLPDGRSRDLACHRFPFQVLGLDRAVAVSAGGAFACALRDDGTLRCWGANGVGQLGSGATLPSPSPTPVRALRDVTAVAAGARHACAVTEGRVWCWGANDRGQLGRAEASRGCRVDDVDVPCETTPQRVPVLDEVVAVAAGAAHTCARTAKGLVLCWGDNRFGQLGIGVAGGAPSPSPQAVLVDDAPLEGARELVVHGDFGCARDQDDAVWCWGRNTTGQLGAASMGVAPLGCVGACSPTPARVPSLDFRASTRDGGPRLVAWDAAEDDAPNADTDAARVGAARYSRGLAAGVGFGCAVLDDGTVRCWGDDTLGQLGDGAAGRAPQGPRAVIATPGAAATNALERAVEVVAGGDTACALLADHSLRCWGSNRGGALGFGGDAAQAGPVPVSW